MTATLAHTTASYNGLQEAYDHFNKELFEGRLPQCLMTLTRHSRSYGYFHSKRFADAYAKDGKPVDEIALNPVHFAERSVAEVLSTLVHEMAHLEQAHFGKEPTRCYHDKQWAGMMKRVGLQPSDTGKRGGKETGPKVSHYIIEGGPFEVSVKKFLAKDGKALRLYQDRLAAMATAKGKGKGGGDDEDGEGEGAEPKSKGRIKFQCKGCELNAWAKPSAKLRCDDCNRPLHACEEGEAQAA